MEADASAFIKAVIEALPHPVPGETTRKGHIYEGYDPRKLNKDLLGHNWLGAQLREMKAEYGDDFDDKFSETKPPNERISNFAAFHWTLEPDDPQAAPKDGMEVFVGLDFAVIHEFSISPSDANSSGVTAASRTELRFAEPSLTALFRGSFIQACGLTPCTPDNWRDQKFAHGLCETCPGVFQCAIEDGIERKYRGCILVTPGEAAIREFNRDPFEYHLRATAFLQALLTLFVNHAKILYESESTTLGIAHLEQRLEELQSLSEVSRESPSRPKPEYLRKELSALQRAFNSVVRVVQTCEDNRDQFEEFGHDIMPDSPWVRKQSGVLRDKTKRLSAARDRIRESMDAARNEVNQFGPTVWQRLTDRIEFVIGCMLPLAVAVVIDGKHPIAASSFTILSALLIIARFVTWDEHKRWSPPMRWLAFFLVVVLVSGACACVIAYARRAAG